MLRSKFVAVLVIAACLSFADPLADFFSRFAGKRNFLVDLRMVFHLRDEDGRFIRPEPETDFILVTRNLEDYYFKLEKPDVFSGIEFVYFSKSGRLYSGFGGKYTLDVVEMPRDYIVKIIGDVLDSLKEPLFKVVKTQSGKDVVYEFEYTQVMRFIIKRLQIEPIRVKIFVDSRKDTLKKLRLLGRNDEYVDIDILKLESLENVDVYFNSVQEF